MSQNTNSPTNANSSTILHENVSALGRYVNKFAKYQHTCINVLNERLGSRSTLQLHYCDVGQCFVHSYVYPCPSHFHVLEQFLHKAFFF